MLHNKKTVRKNKALRKNQRDDKRANRLRILERQSILKRNIGKVVKLSSELPVGEPCSECMAKAKGVNAAELLTLLETVKLTGNSGSGFPTAEKIKTFLASEATKKYILINGAECEPGLLNDAWLMRIRMKEIYGGAEILARALKPDRMLLATRGSSKYKIQADSTVLEAVRLPYRYPMGEEHILIAQALGVKLDVSEIPAEKGILVLNVQTVFQIHRIVNGGYDGGRFVTLANLRTGEGRVAYVHPNTEISELLVKTFDEQNASCYAGGGMMRAKKADINDVFDNTTSFAAIVDELALPKENPCRKCGGCTKKCPMGVSVRDIVLARQDHPHADISGFGADQCMQCGTCGYYCPAGKNPLEYILDGEIS